MDDIRKIAINTGGGDAPGLNAVIRAVVLASLQRGWETWGIRDGYDGLLRPDRFADGGVVRLHRESVRGITHLGGTILGTTNRGNPLAWPVRGEDGELREIDRSDELVDRFRAHGFDALIAIGGDGSMAIAAALAAKGVRVVGVPKTIDNDLEETVVTFGFDSAVDFAADCVGRLHMTAEAHERVMVVEVMGRYAGWIAVEAGVAATADAILIPEIPYEIEKVAEKIAAREGEGRHFSVVVVAEGAAPKDGERTVLAAEAGRAERLGGIGEKVARQLGRLTGKETRCVVLGHLLRGGSPTTRDRLLALRFGAAAVRALASGCHDCMVALDPPEVRYVPLSKAIRRVKTVPLGSDVVRTGRELGISFGD